VSFIRHEYFLLGVIGAGVFALLWLFVWAIKMKIIMEFEHGMTCNYVVKEVPNNLKVEFLFFSFRHLSIRDVFFGLICWAIRIGNPDSSLADIHGASVISECNVDERNIGSSRRVRGVNESNADI
jgi:hypothetical protein